MLIGIFGGPVGVIVGAIIGMNIVGISGAILGWFIGILKKILEKILEHFYSKGFNHKVSSLYVSVTIATGIIIDILTGLGLSIGFNPYLITGLGVSVLPLSGMVIYPSLELKRLETKYRIQESQNLIDP